MHKKNGDSLPTNVIHSTTICLCARCLEKGTYIGAMVKTCANFFCLHNCFNEHMIKSMSDDVILLMIELFSIND